MMPSDILRWLPGPVLNPDLRYNAVQTVTIDLLKRAGKGRTSRPDTWLKVADGLGIGVQDYSKPGQSAGRLSYHDGTDEWVIHYNTARKPLNQASTIIHELAHWYWREAPAEWLCGEKIVYYYEGPVEDERHKLACDVELLILPQAHRSPIAGMFEPALGEELLLP